MATDSELRENRSKWTLLSNDFGIIELPSSLLPHR